MIERLIMKKKKNIEKNKILITFKCLLLCHQIYPRHGPSLDLGKSENKTYVYSLGNFSLGRKNKLRKH